MKQFLRFYSKVFTVPKQKREHPPHLESRSSECHHSDPEIPHGKHQICLSTLGIFFIVLQYFLPFAVGSLHYHVLCTLGYYQNASPSIGPAAFLCYPFRQPPVVAPVSVGSVRQYGFDCPAVPVARVDPETSEIADGIDSFWGIWV